MTIQEKITLASAVIAVISMLVTVVIFRLNYNQAKRISEITLKSNYYNKIFVKIIFINTTKKQD